MERHTHQPSTSRSTSLRRSVKCWQSHISIVRRERKKIRKVSRGRRLRRMLLVSRQLMKSRSRMSSLPTTIMRSLLFWNQEDMPFLNASGTWSKSMTISWLNLLRMRKTMRSSLFQPVLSLPLSLMTVMLKLSTTQEEAAGGQTETNQRMTVSNMLLCLVFSQNLSLLQSQQTLFGRTDTSRASTTERE